MIKILFNEKKIRVSKNISAPLTQIWKIITDTRLWHIWGPSVSSVKCKQRFISLNSNGVIKTFSGFKVSFLITAFKADYYWSWSINGFKATGHKVEFIDKKNTKLSFDIPIWAFFYVFICKIALSRINKLVKKSEYNSLFQ